MDISDFETTPPSPEEYDASMLLKGVSRMSEHTRASLVEWLRNISDMIDAYGEMFTNEFVAYHMKRS